MKNRSLRDDVKNLVKNKINIGKVYKGMVAGQPTIEIDLKEPISNESYLYNKTEDRDSDLQEIEKLLK